MCCIITSRAQAPLEYLEARVASLGIEEGKIKAIGPYHVVREKIDSGAQQIHCGEAGRINSVEDDVVLLLCQVEDSALRFHEARCPFNSQFSQNVEGRVLIV